MTPSQNTRRSFLTTLGLTTGYAAAEIASGSLGIPTTAQTEAEVLSVVSGYGTCLKTHRKDGAVEFLVQMSDAEKFVQVFNPMESLPFDGIQVGEKNSLSFKHRGVQFTVNHAN